jgi:hypothetical protein
VQWKERVLRGHSHEKGSGCPTCTSSNDGGSVDDIPTAVDGSDGGVTGTGHLAFCCGNALTRKTNLTFRTTCSFLNDT